MTIRNGRFAVGFVCGAAIAVVACWAVGETIGVVPAAGFVRPVAASVTPSKRPTLQSPKPERRPVPENWRREEFNGIEVFTIPLQAG
ncbi:MAG: hypothetical protein U0746_20040 [Gemmataceae bacterium]